MKTVKLFIAVVLVIILVLSVFADRAEKYHTIPERESIFSYDKDTYKSWYLYINDGLGQKDIAASVWESGAVAEYRVVYDIALLGYFYYALQVYEDGTGRFTIMVHHGERFEDGELILNKAIMINKDDTEILLNSISENDFWNKPKIQPDENGSIDGTEVFIEGYSDSDTHFICMSNPGKEYGIYKILQAFDDYSTKIADNPLREYAEEYE